MMVTYKGDRGKDWVEFRREPSDQQLTGRLSCYNTLFISYLFIEMSFHHIFKYFKVIHEVSKWIINATYFDELATLPYCINL